MLVSDCDTFVSVLLQSPSSEDIHQWQLEKGKPARLIGAQVSEDNKHNSNFICVCLFL